MSIHLRKVLFSLLLILICVRSGALPAGFFADKQTQDETIRQIFEAERKNVSQFAKFRPMVETYLQSLNPEQFPEPIIDDAYFLRQVALDQDRPASPITQTFVVGGSARDQVVRTNTGWPWPLSPEGYVCMFFVDRTDFDPDHYNLQHEGTESLDGFEYHRFAVTPKKENSVGRFTGQIWVDPKDFHIARLKGVFSTARLSLSPRHLSLSAIRELGINFHFDSWREKTAPGIWMPAHTYFEEKSTHASSRFRTGYHFRGHT